MTLVWASGYNGLTDPDAQAYIAAVELADGQQLEQSVKFAIHEFVTGCKIDGIWDAIKASCILAGARTLGGALVPLKGTAPTNFNFVSGDYNRETGLIGDGSTKYLDSNRADNSSPQNNSHVSVYVSTGGIETYLGVLDSTASSGTQLVANSSGGGYLRLHSSTSVSTGAFNLSTGLVGLSRSNASQITYYRTNTQNSISNTSAAPVAESIHVFRRNYPAAFSHTTARLSFYSIGEALDLAKLDARVSTLMTDIGAAIP